MRKQLPPPKSDRWAEGIDHEPEADTLASLIADMDFQHFGDSLWLKFGGDGDNGETLAYILDALIENGIVSIKILQEER